MDDSAALKSRLRLEVLARRDALRPGERAEASRRIAISVTTLFWERRPRLLAGYWPIRSECDVRPAMAAAADLGIELALPTVLGGRVVFRAWKANEPVVPAGFGAYGPPLDAPIVSPDAMLVPLVGFDRRGHRLGYGKGFYDQAVAALRVAGHDPLLVGVAFAVQEVATVPAEPHDVQLHTVVTEDETITVAAPAG